VKNSVCACVESETLSEIEFSGVSERRSAHGLRLDESMERRLQASKA
jgi:hypothetical protein